MSSCTARPAMRAYRRRILLASLGYAALLMAATWIVVHFAPALPWRVGLALLPALGVVAMFFVVGRYLVEEADEYLRMRLVRQMLWATGATLSIATIYGFLETYDAAPHLPMYVVAIAWFFCLGVAGQVARERAA